MPGGGQSAGVAVACDVVLAIMPPAIKSLLLSMSCMFVSCARLPMAARGVGPDTGVAWLEPLICVLVVIEKKGPTPETGQRDGDLQDRERERREPQVVRERERQRDGELDSHTQRKMQRHRIHGSECRDSLGGWERAPESVRGRKRERGAEAETNRERGGEAAMYSEGDRDRDRQQVV